MGGAKENVNTMYMQCTWKMHDIPPFFSPNASIFTEKLRISYEHTSSYICTIFHQIGDYDFVNVRSGKMPLILVSLAANDVRKVELHVELVTAACCSTVYYSRRVTLLLLPDRQIHALTYPLNSRPSESLWLNCI